MSLIEEALDKAEREKEGPERKVPSSLSPILSTSSENRERKGVKNAILILSIVCIIGSMAWMAYWWMRYRHPGAHPISIEKAGSNLVQSTQSWGAEAHPRVSVSNKEKAKENGEKEKRISHLSLYHSEMSSIGGQNREKKGKSLEAISSPGRKSNLSARNQAQKFQVPTRIAKKSQDNAASCSKRRKKGSSGTSHSISKRARLKKVRNQQRGTPLPPPKRKDLSVQLAKKAIQEGLAFYKEGNLEKAIEALERSMVYAEPTASLLGFLGELYLKRGNLKRAEELLRKAVVKAPSSAENLNRMGMVYLAEGDNTKAIRYFLRSLKVAPYRYTTHVNLGIAYAKIGNLSVAQREFETAVRLQKERPEAYFNLSGVYEARGDIRNAIKCLETFLKISDGIDERKRKEAAVRLEVLRTYLKASKERKR